MIAPLSSYSADVRISLEIDGLSLNVAQVSRDFCILRDRIVCEPTRAVIVLSIDGKIDRREVYLPQGITEDMVKIPLEK